jgi:hypothetical protein
VRPLRRRFCTRSRPSGPSMSPLATTHWRTRAVCQEAPCDPFFGTRATTSVGGPPKNGRAREVSPRGPSLADVSGPGERPLGDAPTPVARPYAPSALPSTTARLLAFLAIVVGGVCGGVIGWSVTDLQCGSDERPAAEQPADEDDGCDTVAGLGAVGGAVVGAGGVAVVAVLVLRAMAEWRRDMDLDDEAAPPPGPPAAGS